MGFSSSFKGLIFITCQLLILAICVPLRLLWISPLLVG